MVNYRLQSKLLEVVDNQLNMNDPKCTKKTLNRLLGLGYPVDESKKMIGAVLAEEMYYVMKHQDPFDEKRYEKKLSLLPDYLEKIEEDSSTVNLQPVQAAPSIGRNDLCTCGSGKKYKKCCGR
ncbi:SEC-C metal-binding domain-containing protein [Bacillus sp. Marseille-Q3570]|uniref:SEC-C metal-binding domain-containing protein n=1 Tax=Bacillus sp. Marseille-Q3570 TaxID=2963522 RepID=UPI0021B6F364|nr:SEC-C metal-binding domain-containing protein [Bacillus sp. Marseille-Q3570]